MERKMNVYTEFSSVKEYNNFLYPISLKNADNLSDKEIFKRLLPINDLAQKLHISRAKVISTINKLLNKQIKLFDLFEYKFYPAGVSPMYGVLVAKNCVYTHKYNKYKREFETIVYDVYLEPAHYYSVAFNKVYDKLLKEIFPQFFLPNTENDFLFVDGCQYNDEQKEDLRKLSKETILSNIPQSLRSVPIKDICKTVFNKKNIENIVKKPRVRSSFWDSDCLYIHICDVEINEFLYSQDLYVPVEALFTKNIELIKNEQINSQATKDENGKRVFISGLQKDMPYFSNELTQKILDYILK